MKEFKFVFPVAATLLCMCLLIYSKSDARWSKDRFARKTFFLLCLMMEVFMVSIALNATATRVQLLPAKVMAIGCTVVLWSSLLFAVRKQMKQSVHKKEDRCERVECN